jgi:hypothetical protein
VFVAGALLVATGCAGSDSVADVETVNGDSADAADAAGAGGANSSGEGASEASRTVVENTATPADSPAAGGSLGSVTAQLQDWYTGEQVPLRIDVTGLVRNGDAVELSMTLTNENPLNPDAEEDAGSYDPNTDFMENAASDDYDISAVSLVDHNAKKRYLPALDSAGACLCTAGLYDHRIQPGESIELAATFGGLPSDVSQVDLHVPGFEPITGIAIQG